MKNFNLKFHERKKKILFAKSILKCLSCIINQLRLSPIMHYALRIMHYFMCVPPLSSLKRVALMSITSFTP